MFKKVDPSMNFAAREENVLKFWQENNIFAKSLAKNRHHKRRFVFFEGPPTANGKPHVGHVLTRVMKDLIPRYKTMDGYQVDRKAGWDTHGLPVELEVEKALGISGKPQIEEFGVEEFIKRCKESVWKYKREWEEMTARVGFWLDMDNAYVTYHDSYIESVWWALKKIWEKGLLYKGYKVVPYCPRCGTALSSHEVSQGYEEVEDPSIYVRFPVKGQEKTAFLVWTTTPWTLPSNVAICVHPDHEYVKVEKDGEYFIMAKALVDKVLGEGTQVVETYRGKDLEGMEYEPPFPYVVPDKKAHFVTVDDYVTLTDGTGIVHIAPAFGEDDARVGRRYDLPVVQPVNAEGKFTADIIPWANLFVKEADPQIIRALKEGGKLYKREQYKHTYPFCWRCDTPLLYYARSSWFIKTTAIKEKLLENNQKINWYPDYIKDGRFGNFLENVIDWGLSRERYWGTPLPIWTCAACGHTHCVGSKEELVGMAKKLPEHLELHKPYIDEAVLACPHCGGDMKRTPEVIDCWFDSGSMPFAQWHYPFENEETFKEQFPAHFISEAIDQTRGWFYTLLVISTLLFDEAPFENCVVLGHVLDEKGQKMSKHKGNVVNPMEVLTKQGADAVRWYLYTVNNPWTPTRFYEEAINEAQRKFLGTLWNVYTFFTLYANIDQFDPRQYSLPVKERARIDRWIVSRFNTVTQKVRQGLDTYDVTGAARAIGQFVDDLSNWYVRRSRRRYWKSEMDNDKIAAYLTLYEVLVDLSKLIAPFVPFVAEEIYQNLVRSLDEQAPESVHLTDYPQVQEELIEPAIEQEMDVAIRLVEAGRSARNRVNIKIRQPLGKVYFVVRNAEEEKSVKALADVILEELNIKTYELAKNLNEFAAYTVKPRYDILGPKYGKLMPQIVKALAAADPVGIVDTVAKGEYVIEAAGERIPLTRAELDIRIEEKSGFAVEGEGGYFAVLDTTLTPELIAEGLAREMVSKIQTMRKEADFAIEDRITTAFIGTERVKEAVARFMDYIKEETLSDEIVEGTLEDGYTKEWDVNGEPVTITVKQRK